MRTKRQLNKTFIAVMIAIMAFGTLILILFSPQVPTSTRLIFIAAILLFGFLISYSLIDRHFKQALGREMRAAPLRTDGAARLTELGMTREKQRGSPAQPFAYQVFDARSNLDGSSVADRLLQQGYKYYHHYVLNLVIGALFLWITFPLLSLSSALLMRDTYLSFNALFGSLLLLVVAFFIAPPRRYLTSFTFSVWAALNFIFLASVVYTGIKSLSDGLTHQTGYGAVVMFLLAGGIIVAYGILFFILASALRRQVTSNKPLHLLFLWVFNSGINVKSTMIGLRSMWRFLGTMQFLRGGDLTVDTGELVRKERAALVVDTPEELERSLKAFSYTPNWLGMYAQNTLLCGDAVWKPAVHAFLESADVVVMNLFGFTKSNQGCLYELGLLVDSFPMKRMLFLVDDTTDLDFLLETLNHNWNHMSVDSPNYTETSYPVRIYQMSNLLERLTQRVLRGPREHKLESFLSTFTTAQSAAARETQVMLRLILEGIVG